MKAPLSLLCIASYFKGENFMRAAKEAGCKVYLLTSYKLKDKDWPREAIDDFFYVPSDENNNWNMEFVKSGLAHTLRKLHIDRIISLDDFDVEKGALLREHFRIAGMGQTTARYFRDKLAMRLRAQEFNIPVPAFTAFFYDDAIHQFAAQTPAPWVVKPRSEASATGIKKVHTSNELWNVAEGLGHNRHEYLVERFTPGDVYHVDTLSLNGDVLFSRCSQYLSPPLEVSQGGGIFRSVTVPFNSKDEKELIKLNKSVMKAFGLRHGASHSEFIKSKEDGKFYFLETSSRVGGAHLADMVEASSGINLWAEWAKLEVAEALGIPYILPPVRNDYAGIIVSLSRYSTPDMTPFKRPELRWTLNMEQHVGAIVASSQRERVLEILDEYTALVARDYHAIAPPKVKAGPQTM